MIADEYETKKLSSNAYNSSCFPQLRTNKHETDFFWQRWWKNRPLIYALVTYGEITLQNLPVAFYVRIPNGASFSVTAGTDASGVATINFTIPEKCADISEVFGEWYTMANKGKA